MCTCIKSIPVIICAAILCVWLCRYVCMWSKMSKMLFSCRYPYYALSVLNIDFPVLSWLRYTVWIPLYPVGFTCEGKSVIWLLARTNSFGSFSNSFIFCIIYLSSQALCCGSHSRMPHLVVSGPTHYQILSMYPSVWLIYSG